MDQNQFRVTFIVKEFLWLSLNRFTAWHQNTPAENRKKQLTKYIFELKRYSTEILFSEFAKVEAFELFIFLSAMSYEVSNRGNTLTTVNHQIRNMVSRFCT